MEIQGKRSYTAQIIKTRTSSFVIQFSEYDAYNFNTALVPYCQRIFVIVRLIDYSKYLKMF